MIKKISVLLLLIIILLSIAVIFYQSRGELSFPKLNIAQFLSPIIYFKNTIRDFLNLKEENENLKKQLIEISLQKKSHYALIDENKRLRDLLALKESKKDIVTIANVISKGSNKFLKTIWIDKGSNHGIKKGYPVVTPNGLVGKVISANSNYSEIMLITDPNFSVAVRIDRNRVEGILSGNGNNCLVKYIPLEEDVLTGDRIITSGLDEVFPEGILVGAVTSVNKKKGLFQLIEVIPMQPENKIEEVAIIKKGL